MIRQVVCRGVTLGRRGISVVSTNTKNPSPGDTPGRAQRTGVPHTSYKRAKLTAPHCARHNGAEFILYTVSWSMMKYLIYLLPNYRNAGQKAG